MLDRIQKEHHTQRVVPALQAHQQHLKQLRARHATSCAAVAKDNDLAVRQARRLHAAAVEKVESDNQAKVRVDARGHTHMETHYWRNTFGLEVRWLQAHQPKLCFGRPSWHPPKQLYLCLLCLPAQVHAAKLQHEKAVQHWQEQSETALAHWAATAAAAAAQASDARTAAALAHISQSQLLGCTDSCPGQSSATLPDVTTNEDNAAFFVATEAPPGDNEIVCTLNDVNDAADVSFAGNLQIAALDARQMSVCPISLGGGTAGNRCAVAGTADSEASSQQEGADAGTTHTKVVLKVPLLGQLGMIADRCADASLAAWEGTPRLRSSIEQQQCALAVVQSNNARSKRELLSTAAHDAAGLVKGAVSKDTEQPSGAGEHAPVCNLMNTASNTGSSSQEQLVQATVGGGQDIGHDIYHDKTQHPSGSAGEVLSMSGMIANNSKQGQFVPRTATPQPAPSQLLQSAASGGDQDQAGQQQQGPHSRVLQQLQDVTSVNRKTLERLREEWHQQVVQAHEANSMMISQHQEESVGRAALIEAHQQQLEQWHKQKQVLEAASEEAFQRAASQAAAENARLAKLHALEVSERRAQEADHAQVSVTAAFHY
jgi:hypothetical protein